MSADADRYACPVCSEIHERVCARIAADRIAALEAELAEARLYKDDVERFEEEVKAEGAAHERTKAELAAALEQRDIARAEWQGAEAGESALLTERDAALAEAAAMREALQALANLRVDGRNSTEGADRSHVVTLASMKAAKALIGAGATGIVIPARAVYRARRALQGDAGRALAARVPLLEAVAIKARAAMGNPYRAGADDELRAALAALDEKGGTDAQG